jgi:hypothetical protein
MKASIKEQIDRRNKMMTPQPYVSTRYGSTKGEKRDTKGVIMLLGSSAAEEEEEEEEKGEEERNEGTSIPKVKMEREGARVCEEEEAEEEEREGSLSLLLLLASSAAAAEEE